jgi:hypothetical protein
MARKITSISIPEEWIFFLRRKALEVTEETGKHTTVSQVIVKAVQEKFNLKLKTKKREKRNE